MTQRSVQGQIGEQLAAEYCLKRGYKIIDQNWRSKAPRGEIDIIARDGNTLVFIEVKAVAPHADFLPEDHLTPAKLQRVARLAFAYLNKIHQTDRAYRIDLIAITLNPGAPDLRHYENAVVDTY